MVLFLIHELGIITEKHFERYRKLHPHILFAVLSPHMVRYGNKEVFGNATRSAYRGTGGPLMWFLDVLPWAPVHGLAPDVPPRFPCTRMFRHAKVLLPECLNGFVVSGAHEVRSKNCMPLWEGLSALPASQRDDLQVTVRHAAGSWRMG